MEVVGFRLEAARQVEGAAGHCRLAVVDRQVADRQVADRQVADRQVADRQVVDRQVVLVAVGHYGGGAGRHSPLREVEGEAMATTVAARVQAPWMTIAVAARR